VSQEVITFPVRDWWWCSGEVKGKCTRRRSRRGPSRNEGGMVTMNLSAGEEDEGEEAVDAVLVQVSIW
jgi:hypothetical protein